MCMQGHENEYQRRFWQKQLSPDRRLLNWLGRRALNTP